MIVRELNTKQKHKLHKVCKQRGMISWINRTTGISRTTIYKVKSDGTACEETISKLKYHCII